MSENDMIAVGISVFVAMACLVVWVVHSSPEITETKFDEPALPPQELPKESSSEVSFNSSQALGAVLALSGLAGIVLSFFMEISHTGGIVNLGLMNDRVVVMIGSGFGLLTGALLMVLAGKK
jgi:hypothetical protein